MRITIELPDALLREAKMVATQENLTLKQLFVEALEHRIRGTRRKMRLTPPQIGGSEGPLIDLLTPEQTDKAMFG